MPHTEIVKWSLHFIFSYAQPLHSVTNGERPLQSVQSQCKTRTIPVINIGKPSRHATVNQLSAMINGTQSTQVNPQSMHCTCCGMLKSTCQVETMSNNEKIKPLVLAVIKLRFSEGIGLSGSQ